MIRFVEKILTKVDLRTVKSSKILLVGHVLCGHLAIPYNGVVSKPEQKNPVMVEYYLRQLKQQADQGFRCSESY